MNQRHYGAPLKIQIEADALTIRVGVATLAHAVKYSDWANPYDEQMGDYVRSFAITDARQFAADVIHAMLDEREDGSTPLSDFLDKMTEAAVDDGSIACEHDQRIKPGEHAVSEVAWAASPTEGKG